MMRVSVEELHPIEGAASRAVASEECEDRLVLPYDKRQKSRFVAELESGQEVFVQLPRGTLLRGGTQLAGRGGRRILVVAAPQALSVVVSRDLLLLSRVAYHLGNRHVPLQVELGRLVYEHDHVLDDMVHRLGAEVVVEQGPFEP